MMDNYLSLIEFLDRSYNQGNLKFQTARTRKTAIRRVFENNSYSDVSVLELNIEKVMEDFLSTLNTEMSIDTINTYKSRISRTIEDYIRIEKLGESPKKSNILAEKKSKVIDKKIVMVEVQCPIREGEIIIDIKNLPVNLNEEELNRIVEMIKLVTK